MDVNDDLLDVWRASEIQICTGETWVTLWDGYKFHPDSFPAEATGQYLYVLTAYNPGSEPLGDAENRLRNRQLHDRLKELGVVTKYVSVGRSLSGSHEEFGFALYGLDQSIVENLALEFGQIGFYRFSEHQMEIFAIGESGKFILM